MVSMVKGIVTRWKAESGRSGNSSRVNAVDSAGRSPDAGHPCEVQLEVHSGRQVRRECRPEAAQLPSMGLDLDLGDVEATIASLRSELSQKPPAEVVRERDGAIRSEDQGALRCVGAELGRTQRGDTRGVKRSVAGGSAGACEEAGSMAHGSGAASPSLLGCTRASRSARLRDGGIDWVGTSRSRRAHLFEPKTDGTSGGLRQGRSRRAAFKAEGETAAKRARLGSDLEPLGLFDDALFTGGAERCAHSKDGLALDDVKRLIEEDLRERNALTKDQKRSLREGQKGT